MALVPIPVGAAMVKKSKKASKLAPLERDVEPNLRKLTFVRARYARGVVRGGASDENSRWFGCPLSIPKRSSTLWPRLNFRTLSRATAVPRATAAH